MQKILNMLLKATYYSSLNQISQKLEVSKRSIYYDICKLNEWLEYYNVSGLKVVREKEYLLMKIIRKKITRKVSKYIVNLFWNIDTQNLNKRRILVS